MTAEQRAAVRAFAAEHGPCGVWHREAADGGVVATLDAHPSVRYVIASDGALASPLDPESVAMAREYAAECERSGCRRVDAVARSVVRDVERVGRHPFEVIGWAA